MMIENLITYISRKKNADYLQFIPSTSLDMHPTSADAPTLLYMHVPFCEELCPYCSFNRVVFQEGLAREYYRALRKEILMYKKLGYDFRALYVGGGTPTVLIDELDETINLIKENYHISEISVETNPNHLTSNNIEHLKGMGVNRLSVGVQTFDNGILKALERYHKYGSSEEIADRLKYTQGIFNTLNVDMIFNFPTQTMEILENDLSTLIGLGVDQVTYYPLMVSSYTKDVMSKKLGVVNYEKGNQLYFKIIEMLSVHYVASTAWCFSKKERMPGEAPVHPRDVGRTVNTHFCGYPAPSDVGREGIYVQAQADIPANISERTSLMHTENKEGATQANTQNVSAINSSHGEREGKAPTALPVEGATQAPVIDEYVVHYEEYAGIGSGSIGYLGGVAYANTFDIRTYIDQVDRGMLPITGKRVFSIKERLCYDFLMKLFGLSLDIKQLSIRNKVNANRYLWSEILFFRFVGGLKKSGNTLFLTKKGQYYWVLMMREFFIGVNNFRDFCRAEMVSKTKQGR
ncbi:MAG: radical SAM protein [Proteobacteria bacterium]|nr:radical SAM protein [Pseudomonadota bacterium]